MNSEQARKTAIDAMKNLIEIIEKRREKLLSAGIDKTMLVSSEVYVDALKRATNRLEMDAGEDPSFYSVKFLWGYRMWPRFENVDPPDTAEYKPYDWI